MPLSLGARWLEWLLCLSLLIQTLEYLRLLPALADDGYAPWRLQRADIPQAWIRRVLDVLFTPAALRAQLLLRLVVLALIALQGSSLGLVMFLFISHLLILIRWRGAFNGGSDFMTLVALTGLLIVYSVALAGNPELGWRAGLWYVGLQSITSYFVSGWVKLLQPQWRSGKAMPIFLECAVYGPLAPGHVLRHPLLGRLGAWAFIVWECCSPLALWHPLAAWAFCAVALVFHFLVFWFFGLNRFFWAWLVSFPAILACSAQGIF